ncbi:hypothetical protein K505DRAFT_147896 [Melanomma pulvis-pyrius CBS 109.77]|uniref:Uncharacterized protein n=1 Tax=Melanomma pulvis-pyrius CBS 109.77 TaxID=1314802 RepID=A0A6A6WR83_9PLEO|nr:hypothetical protein K505DRAFT_147896 [Melanomma pulvis-pyrius CBS 109.77]
MAFGWPCGRGFGGGMAGPSSSLISSAARTQGKLAASVIQGRTALAASNCAVAAGAPKQQQAEQQQRRRHAARAWANTRHREGHGEGAEVDGRPMADVKAGAGVRASAPGARPRSAPTYCSDGAGGPLWDDNYRNHVRRPEGLRWIAVESRDDGLGLGVAQTPWAATRAGDCSDNRTPFGRRWASGRGRGRRRAVAVHARRRPVMRWCGGGRARTTSAGRWTRC